MSRTLAYGTLLCLVASGPAAAQPAADVVRAGGNPFFSPPAGAASPQIAPVQYPAAGYPGVPAMPGGYGPPGGAIPSFAPPQGGGYGYPVGPEATYPADDAPRRRVRTGTPLANEPRWWAGVEYLYWHISDSPLPVALAATTQADSLTTVAADPLGVSNPVQRDFRYGMASGGRLNLGYWGEEWCDVTYGLEGSAFLLERRADGFALGSGAGGAPAILRPFVDARTGQPNFAVVAFPGSQVGNLAVNSTVLVWGAETNLVRRINEGGGWHWDMLAGVRYLDLDENLSVVQNTTLTGTGLAGFGGQTIRAPRGVSVSDQFDTRSQFFGGQIGTRVGKRFDRLTVDTFVKVGLGWGHHTGNVSGTTTLIGPGAGAGRTLSGGLLAVRTNSGHLEANDFVAVPEFGLQLGYDVTDWLRLTGGYSALYWSRVARPGRLLTGTVSPVQVPSSLEFGRAGTPVGPSTLSRDDLWLNGVNVGAVIKF